MCDKPTETEPMFHFRSIGDFPVSAFEDYITQTKVQHPAWRRYWDAEQEWRRLNDAAAQAHRRMKDAADELVQAGEMQRDGR